MVLLDIASILQKFSDDFIIFVVSGLISLVTSYIYIRERILKNEIKNESKFENMMNLISAQNTLFESKIHQIQEEIVDFKEINKEATKSLIENTAAIRELKVVLNMLKSDLTDMKKERNK